jgi:hypothetical protein
MGRGGKEAGRGGDRFKVRDLIADERCTQAILDLHSADVGRRVVPEVAAEEEIQSEASEWQLRGREERED